MYVSLMFGTERKNRGPSQNLEVIILAGGNCRRMGFNKLFMKFCGQPLITQVVQVASQVSKNLTLVIGFKDPEKNYASILPGWVKIVRDTTENKAALFGMVTGLEAAKADYAVILAADIPFVNAEVIKLLYHESKDFDLVIPSWPNGNIEPLYAVYKVSTVLKIFRKAVKNGKVRIRDAINGLKRINYIPVEKLKYADSSLHCFININTPEDIMIVENIITYKALSKF